MLYAWSNSAKDVGLLLCTNLVLIFIQKCDSRAVCVNACKSIRDDINHISIHLWIYAITIAILCVNRLSIVPSYFQLRARRAEGVLTYQQWSVENQKGAIAVQSLLAIAPFWFSMVHRWTATMPFWLSADDAIYSVHIGLLPGMNFLRHPSGYQRYIIEQRH